jgi:hypothetical protein
MTFQSFFMLMTNQPSFFVSSESDWGKVPTLESGSSWAGPYNAFLGPNEIRASGFGGGADKVHDSLFGRAIIPRGQRVLSSGDGGAEERKHQEAKSNVEDFHDFGKIVLPGRNKLTSLKPACAHAICPCYDSRRKRHNSFCFFASEGTVNPELSRNARIQRTHHRPRLVTKYGPESGLKRLPFCLTPHDRKNCRSRTGHQCEQSLGLLLQPIL